jgi:hypothetical protein
MRKTFNCKSSRISMLEVRKPVPELYSLNADWFEYCFRYIRWFLLVESFDLRLSNQYILVLVIPSCFCFAIMCLCQVSKHILYLLHM